MEFSLVDILAGKTTTDDELEEMLESGNPSIFTSDVSAGRLCGLCVCFMGGGVGQKGPPGGEGV